MKLLIGGSPCTHWSIAQTKNRETEARGIGWELFLNYRIARDQYQPDYFLYENNKSMAPAIRAQITEALGVAPVLINSALVSAQNRQRLYWVGKRNPDGTYSQVDVEQPADRGILLRDILETADVPSSVDGAAEPVRIGAFPGKNGLSAASQSRRIYSSSGKSVPLCAGGGGSGAKTGLYAIPTADAGDAAPVYEVRGGQIAIKGNPYPIKLADGFYVIRKLSVAECKRLQTVPDTYAFPVSDAQAYKMLGNGWTVDVIAHILSHFEGLTAEPVEALSMYDGMSCGHIALDKLGASVAAYYATEIDKYAIQTTQKNYPETVQLGDAFQVREPGWLPERRIANDL